MALARLAIRTGPVVFGLLWAGLLTVFGLTLLASASGPGASSEWFWVGIFLIAAGQFVCMVLVADRLCRPRAPALAYGVELLTALVTLLTLVVASVRLLT
ncbi:MAG: hypothetical protein AAFX05_05430 [Planctomycetota bacterium]